MLAMIAERDGRVVTYEELRLKFWPQIEIEDYKHSLGNSILTIRKTLGDSAQERRYIETVRSGYRMRVPVTIIDEATSRNGSRGPHQDDFLPEVDEIRRTLLTTSRPWDLALLLFRCETLVNQYSLHPRMPELKWLMVKIKMALEHSAALEPNWENHIISREAAALVFSDPNAISIPGKSRGDRWTTLGRVSASVLLAVEHTAPVEDDPHAVRIIAARRATPQERRFYEQSSK
jgi:uncharacterized protein